MSSMPTPLVGLFVVAVLAVLNAGSSLLSAHPADGTGFTSAEREG
jgi:hypothetical protein